jgi:hypothetical protein
MRSLTQIVCGIRVLMELLSGWFWGGDVELNYNIREKKEYASMRSLRFYRIYFSF